MFLAEFITDVTHGHLFYSLFLVLILFSIRV